jgi:hypothetical protein
MKTYFSFLILLCLAISCHTNKSVVAEPKSKSLAEQIADTTVVASHSGNGTSFADAVIIQEKKSESDIWPEEDAWLAERYPGYIVISNRLESKNGADGTQKLYNVRKIKTPDEAVFEVFFDVSLFYNGQTK